MGFLALAGVASASPATVAGLTEGSLAARTGGGPTLFTALPPEATGIVAPNPYDDPAMWSTRYREFSLGAIGTGVAIADYDGDGRPDVFIVAKTGPNRLFRNLGGFRFEDVSERAGVAGPTGAWKQGAAFADIDNDGRPDLYVCRFDAPNLLYRNLGDGTFREEAAARGLALSDASGMAAFADYDRDGWLDVYVQTNVLDAERRPNGQRDRLYHNNGDGTFAEVTDRAGIRNETQGHSATWWDFDEDGWPDLYVANDFKDPDQLYRNNGNATFADVLDHVVPHTPHSSMGADLGDLDGDGHADLLVADMAATTRYKDHRGMAKIRDGLAEDERHPEVAPQYMRNALLLGTGTGRVLEAANLAGLTATDWTWSVRLEDLDLDGRVDVHITNGMVRELHADDVIRKMAGRESPTERMRIMIATPVLEERNLAYRNHGDLRFEDASRAWGLDQAGVAFGAAFGDLDGDGDLDLVFSSFNAPATACRNDGTGGHAAIFDLRGSASNRFGVGAVVRLETAAGTQVRTLTLARGYLSTSEPAVHFGLGDATEIRRVTVTWPSGRVQEFTGLAADRRYLVTEPAAGSAPAPAGRPAPQFSEISERLQLGPPSHERPLNEWSRQPLLPFRQNRPGPPALVADLDGDNQDDFVLGGAAGETGRLLSNLGDGQFLAYGANVFPDATAADGPMLALDADADGDLDLLTTKSGAAAAPGASAYAARLFLNSGRGRFAPAPAGMLPALATSVGAVAAADFERTGRLGLFLGGRVAPGNYPQASRSALLAWRGTGYADVTAEVAPALAGLGMVTAALWSDVDGDGWVDLLVAVDWGTVRCLRNDGGGRLEDATDRLGFGAGGRGWWRSLAAADFNGDGRLDYAAGNVGLNTRYRASAEYPAVLLAGVSLGGSPGQLVEAQAEAGVFYPLRCRDVMLKAFPALARRYPTAESYARAPLDEVFGAETLAAAARLEATELRSGVFLSQPDGTFRFAPLPWRAQLAPIHGQAAGDWDGDGRADLLVAGNFFGPTVETGRFDGADGWLLRGDGRGGFAAAVPADSGFVVPGDGRALAVADLERDGWPDALVTRNNDGALFFRNLGAPGRHSFGVYLRGAPGNPAAVGARLALTLSDGSTQVAEVAAGSGYFAQSSSAVHFGYAAAAPVRLEIRWPDGRVSRREFAAPPTGTLNLASP